MDTLLKALWAIRIGGLVQGKSRRSAGEEGEQGPHHTRAKVTNATILAAVQRLRTARHHFSTPLRGGNEQMATASYTLLDVYRQGLAQPTPWSRRVRHSGWRGQCEEWTFQVT